MSKDQHAFLVASVSLHVDAALTLAPAGVSTASSEELVLVAAGSCGRSTGLHPSPARLGFEPVWCH